MSAKLGAGHVRTNVLLDQYVPCCEIGTDGVLTDPLPEFNIAPRKNHYRESWYGKFVGIGANDGNAAPDIGAADCYGNQSPKQAIPDAK